MVIIILSDIILGNTLRYFYFTEGAGLHYRTTYSIEQTTADVIVFGSSKANHNYVPDIFEKELGLSFYNAGRDGASIFYHLAVLKSILKRHKPNFVILDFAGKFDKSRESYERLSSLLPYYEKHKEIRKIVEQKSPYERIKLVSRIYPFNSMLVTIIVGNMKFNRNRKDDQKGYVALKKEWQVDIDSVNVQSFYEIDKNKINALREFIDCSKQADIQLVVVFSPIYYLYNRDYTLDLLHETCSEKNVSFYDFSKTEIFLSNKKLFQDRSHLNQNGARVFSDMMIKILKDE